MSYNAFDWYWKADDNRIFSSKRQMLVPESDPGFVDFLGKSMATPWPRDDQGNQTDKALQDVLRPYATIFVNDEYFARNELDEAINGGFMATGIASAPSGMPTMSAQYNRTEINIAAIRSMNDQNYTTIWVGADGNFYPLTNNEIKDDLAGQLSDHMQACYDAYVDAVNGVRAKKYTKRDQVRELFAKFVRGKWPSST